jgi:general secretion pathway protein D
MSAAETRRSAERAPQAPRWRLTLCATAAALWLAGCAAQRLHDDGLSQIEQGKAKQGVDSLRSASEMEPNNLRYRIDYLNQRQFQVQHLLQVADMAWQDGRLDEAQLRLREVLQLEPTNDRAVRSLVQVEERRRADVQVQQAEKQAAAGQLDAARDTLKRVVHDWPQHPSAPGMLRSVEDRMAADRAAREEKLGSRAALRKPVTLQFRDAALRLVFEAISRATNINIIMDRDVRADLRSTIFVKDAAVEDTIDLILLQNQLEKRVLNSNTLLVYPATAAKQKEYGELRIRSFQLSNVEAAYMANIIKTMLKTKDIVTDVRTNTLVMRDTPEAVAVAEQLVATNDVPEPEVMLEVEVMEITTSRNSEIGIKWPTAFNVSTPTTSTTAADGTKTTDPTTWGGLRALTRNQLVVSALSVGLNLQLTDSDTNILASPRIRARNKEKARIMVGDKVPVITNMLASQGTATTASNTATNNYITGSIQYLEVGLKLEVEPQVYAEGDVAIKINLDVSNVVNTVSTQSGTAYQIGTRNAQTVLRLKDGETQVLAGLIKNEDSNTASKVPGLGQFPVLGRLFRNDKDAKTKSEIVLSITPHIIRPLAVPDMSRADLFTGSEATVRSRPLRVEPIETMRIGGAVAPGGAIAPAAVAAPAPAPAPVPQTLRLVPPPAGVTLQAHQPVVVTPAEAAAPTPAPAPAPAPTPARVAPAAAPAAPVAPPGSGGIAPIQSGMPGIPATMPRVMPGRVPMAAPAPTTPPPIPRIVVPAPVPPPAEPVPAADPALTPADPAPVPAEPAPDQPAPVPTQAPLVSTLRPDLAVE